MIAYLRGQLLDKTAEGGVVLDVGGVGYQLLVTAATMKTLSSAGGEVRLHVRTLASQDNPMQLFGFAETEERRLFDLLLAVQGVGPKLAIAILSAIPAGELLRALGAGDVARLTQIRGVGRKTAERLTVELRDKVASFGPAGTLGTGVVPVAAGVVPPGPLGDVYGALIGLGFRAAEIDSVIAGLDPEQEAAVLVKQALAALRRR